MSELKLSQVFLYLPNTVLEKDCILNTWTKIPKISFGISGIEGYENIFKAIDTALETGYRSFDVYPINNQEEFLGSALKELLPKHNLTRQDITIINKLLPRDYGSADDAFYRSCDNLKTAYIDIYLMQWPGGENLESDDEENGHLRRDTWDELLNLGPESCVRGFGVSNFTVKHLEDIRESSSVIPAINQVEFHPRCPQVELLEYCKDNNILIQATSFRDSFHPLLLNDDTVKKVSKSVNKTPTQVLLKWAINKGVAVIPQSEHPNKIKQNFQLFDFVLEKPHMDALNSITLREKYLRNSISVV